MDKVQDFRIDKYKYLELRYFCLQYPVWRQKGIEFGKCRLIEQTAIEADPETYDLLLKNVTEGISYEYMAIPRGRRQFYMRRRKFFWLLSERR